MALFEKVCRPLWDRTWCSFKQNGGSIWIEYRALLMGCGALLMGCGALLMGCGALLMGCGALLDGTWGSFG